MRQSGQSNDTVFDQADNRGDDSRYSPGGGGRLSSENQSRALWLHVIDEHADAANAQEEAAEL
eukprot:4390260-Pleurochrysis_carterae.AAC.5